MKILFIFPTIFEAEPFFKFAGAGRPALGKVAHANLGSVKFAAIVSGYACERARQRVESFAKKQNPDFAILCGYCGACRSEQREGDFLFDTSSDKLRAAFESVGAKPARIACEPSVAGAERKAELAKLGYDAVDMESELLKGLFEPNAFASFRCISDSVDSKIPAEFFDAMIDRKSGGCRFFCADMLRVLNPLRNPLLIPHLLEFSLKASKVSRHYSGEILRLLENLAKI